MKMMYQKLEDNPEIMNRNLVMFAKMIKYETMLRNIQHRNEVIKNNSTRILLEVEDQMRAILRAQGLGDQDLDQYNPQFGEEESQTDSAEENAIESESSDSYGGDPETDVPFDRRAWRELQAQRRHHKQLLQKQQQLYKSKHLFRLESEYKRVLEQICTLRQDRGNYALLCWKDLDGYDLIAKSAKTYKTKHKS